MSKEKEFKLSELIEFVKDGDGIRNYDGCFVFNCSDVKEFIKRLKEKVDEFRSYKYYVHDVNDCECCKKNVQNIWSILEEIDKLSGDLK